MSFILDALKKSESDRQQSNRPESAYVATGADESTPSRWVLFVGALLLINVVVLLIVFLRPEPTVIAAPAVTAVDEERVQDPDSFRDLVANARETQITSPVQEIDAGSELSSPPIRTIEREIAVADVPMPAPAPSASAIAYQSFNEARANGSVELPDLHLDLHVYNSTPGDRFVFINMSRYGEKTTLTEGPFVTEIVPEGVILEYSGARFLLPRE